MSSAVTVLIPTALRPQVEGKESINLQGSSVKQILASLTG